MNVGISVSDMDRSTKYCYDYNYLGIQLCVLASLYQILIEVPSIGMNDYKYLGIQL